MLTAETFSPPWSAKRNTQQASWIWSIKASSRIAIGPSASHEAKPEIAVIFTICPFWPNPRVVCNSHSPRERLMLPQQSSTIPATSPSNDCPSLKSSRHERAARPHCSARPTCESCKSIDVRRWHRDGLFYAVGPLPIHGRVRRASCRGALTCTLNETPLS